MFLRTKTVKGHKYLQIVENRRERGPDGQRVRQRVIASLGRLDEIGPSGGLDALIQSASRFCETIMVISAHRSGQLPASVNRGIGPPLVFERLWSETGCREVLQEQAQGRRFLFSLERAVFLTVLHRLFDPGSDRAAEKWKAHYRIDGAQQLELHQLYRAMAWLGEPLLESEQTAATPFAARCIKDRIEEALFARRRHLFQTLELVFFDTTSIYFEGEGGETLGRRGPSKDHRPDLPQMVVGVVLDDQGLPICTEMWPGNTTDVKSLVPVVDRLQQRFAIRRICIVADRGMISQQVIEALESEDRSWDYILGARLRASKEVRTDVLARADRYREVVPPRQRSKDPAPLKVKELAVDGRRYVLCLNVEQARHDALARQAIVESLEKQLQRGDKSLVGNKGYRKYLKTRGSRFEIDSAKIKDETRYDGKWVLRTSLDLPAEQVALKYKQLWMVEEMMRTIKSVLQTRPIYHKKDATIRGHVFCSFLALVLRAELQGRLEETGRPIEWADVIQDLDELEEIEVKQGDKTFILRTQAKGVAGVVCQAAGVALPPTVRQAKSDQPQQALF